MSPFDLANQLLSVRMSDKAPLSTVAHWAITPELWMEMKAHPDAVKLVEITGSRTQRLMGLPVRIVKQGASPALDLVEIDQ